ncbi:MAG TPA: hypothetical protein VKM93_25720 [Terriglobia bacterium]|nr:hypothetical protein [Terriglobia bacterium]
MVKTALVRSDREVGGLVLEALSRARIPVTLCDWKYFPESDEWQLIIATPWYDSKGPLEAISLMIKAFQVAGIYQDVPLLRLLIRSPKDDLVKELEKNAKDRREGAIHVVEHPGSNHHKQYSLIFAPFTGPGGAVPAKRFSKIEDLRQFLGKRLHIRPSSVQDALAELASRGNASIFDVRLTPQEARDLGLA